MNYFRNVLFYFFIVSNILSLYTINCLQNQIKPPNFSDLEEIHYGFSSFFRMNITKIRAALKSISDKTCIKFKEVNYIEVTSDKGFTFQQSYICHTTNGPVYRDKKHIEYIRLNENCANKKGKILSLIVRMLGLINPINRPDRDNYVSINMKKIGFVDKGVIDKYKPNEVELYNTSFDYSSIALYKNYSYKTDGPRAVSLKDQNFLDVVRYRYELSFNDFRMLNEIYCLNKKFKNKTICNNGGYEDLEVPDSCICPDYFNGTDCSALMRSDQNCTLIQNATINDTKKEVLVFLHGYNYCYQEIFSPTGRNVTISIIGAKLTENICIPGNGAEVKFLPDLGASGLRLCGYHRNIKLYSNSTKMLVAYRGNVATDYIFVSFKIV